MLSHVPVVLAACVGLTTAASTPYTKNGLVWSPDSVRMNHIQVLGSHNSYHREGSRLEQLALLAFRSDAQNLFYSHPSLNIQASHQNIRSFELDIFADPDGGNYATPLIRSNFTTEPIAELEAPGIKVLHIADLDYHTTCSTFKGCLGVIKDWSTANPGHVPIPIMIEFKTAEAALVLIGGSKVISWDKEELLQGLDDEIRSIFDEKSLITPDDIRRDSLTLEESILTYGWPDLHSARGRVMFLMDNGPDHPVRDTYIKDRASLEARVLFTNSAPGKADCAFQKLNEPTGDGLANIQEQVKAGYWVRTRADVPLDTLLSDDVTGMRDAAFSSGAHILSTDFQTYGMSSRWNVDYEVQFENGGPARCNPVLTSNGCTDGRLENGK